MRIDSAVMVFDPDLSRYVMVIDASYRVALRKHRRRYLVALPPVRPRQ